MAGKRVLAAICLALILIICSTPIGWTEPPPGGSYSPSGNPVNGGGGGEGHPWDDNPVGNEPPDSLGEQERVMTSTQPEIIPVISIGTEPAGGVAIRSAIRGVWRKMMTTYISVSRSGGIGKKSP